MPDGRPALGRGFGQLNNDCKYTDSNGISHKDGLIINKICLAPKLHDYKAIFPDGSYHEKMTMKGISEFDNFTKTHTGVKYEMFENNLLQEQR